MTDPRMTPTNDAPVTVEQCDRDGCADFELIVGRINERDAERIRAGDWDETKDVLWFARHRLRLAALASAPAGDGTWLHMDDAPKAGTILELAVDYTDGGGALQDALIACTIGWNDLDNTGVDKWHIVGWSWTHDYICEGSGLPIAWRPSRLNATDEKIGPLPARPVKGEGQ